MDIGHMYAGNWTSVYWDWISVRWTLDAWILHTRHVYIGHLTRVYWTLDTCMSVLERYFSNGAHLKYDTRPIDQEYLVHRTRTSSSGKYFNLGTCVYCTLNMFIPDISHVHIGHYIFHSTRNINVRILLYWCHSDTTAPGVGISTCPPANGWWF